MTKDLSDIVTKLRAASGTNQALVDLSTKCAGAAEELLEALQKPKSDGQKSRRKSLQKALKGLWGRDRVEELRWRVQGYRDELNLKVLVYLSSVPTPVVHTLTNNCRTQIDIVSAQQSANLASLNVYSQKALDALTSIVLSQQAIVR